MRHGQKRRSDEQG
ncbi:hypothetical protein STIAU_7160, partial [Stigmatella aurantiaca DW4/3-1]